MCQICQHGRATKTQSYSSLDKREDTTMDYITTVALALSGLIGIILLAVALAGMGSGFHGRTTYAA